MPHKVSARKAEYKAKLIRYLQDHKNILVVTANHVGSHQLQQIRQELRGRALVLMGKNTLVRMVLREYADQDPTINNFMPCVRGNCGFVFTNEDIKEIRDVLAANRVSAMARPGVIAPNDVVVEPGPTGLDPGQTGFFQALSIPTKIFKGQIEMISKTYLINKGDKVGSSECSLLNKLNIKPFEYGLELASIYSDGAVFSPEVIDLTEGDLVAKFFQAVRVTAALGLRIGVPNIASIPHSFGNAFKKLLAVSVQSGFLFEAAKPYKEFLDDPDAYRAAHGVVVAAAATDAKEEEAEAPAEEEEEDESSEGGALNMFISDSDSDSD